jgi:hypothetical protein
MMSDELRAKHHPDVSNAGTEYEFSECAVCCYNSNDRFNDLMSVTYPCDVIKALDESYAIVTRLSGELELTKAERDASRTYSQGFAARIRELTQEHAQLSETLEEVRVTLDMAVREPTFEGVERGSAKALAILNKAGLESPGASHDASVTSEET